MESSVNPVQHNSTAEVGVDSSDNHSNTKGSRIVEANSKTRMEAHSTSSTPASRKNPKQVQTNQANVIQSTPTAQSTKYKPVNAHSRNRAETSSSGSRDKTPDKNNKKKHYIYQYETRVTFKINVSPLDDPLTRIRQIVNEYLRELSQCDSTASILPWKHTSDLKASPSAQ